MDEYAQLRGLLELVEAVGIEIRRAPALSGSGQPGGALVRLRGREVLFVDPSASVADRIAVAASTLRGREALERMYLPPAIRALIEGA